MTDMHKILTEWTYRLDSGYPKTDSDYEVLRDVLTELTDFERPVINTIVNQSKGITEAKPDNELDPNSEQAPARIHQGDFNLHPEFIEIINAAGKQNDFNQFLELLPKGASIEALQRFFDNITESEMIEFSKLLYTETSIDALDNLKFDEGVAAKLVQLEPKGLGRGEIYLSALIRGAKVSGGGESYDLTVPPSASEKEGPYAGKTKFEVKDYRTSKSSAIRLGVKGVITKQNWWRTQILPTLELMKQLLETDNGIDWINQPDNKGVKDFINYLNKPSSDGRTRFDFIPTGEFNKSKDLPAFIKAYDSLASIATSTKESYDMMILRGPNQKPVSLAVDVPSTDVYEDIETLNVKVIGTAGIDQIITRLRRLEYIRNPQQLTVDLQNSVNDIIGDEIPFILFRPDGIKVLSDFKFAGISQGGIKIIEQR
jgi:hypothetical protein